MELGALKPLLAGLAMPPLSLLLLALLGLVLSVRSRRTGLALATGALAVLWLVSCHGTAVWLARHALPQYAPVNAQALKASGTQAIVILGGGLLPQAPEYGEPQPSADTAARLRHGIWLGRQSGLPLAFTGGVGWSADSGTDASESAAAARVAQQDYGITLRWLESASRDTGENASLLSPLLRRDGITRIALVTSAWHMPRAAAAFERAGLTVIAAPSAYVLRDRTLLLEWIPSASGLLATQTILRERLAMSVSGWLRS